MRNVVALTCSPHLMLMSRKFAKITEGIMTSHGCFLCLLLLTVILIEPSEANCQNYFTKKEWNTTTLHKLPENITVKIMNKSEDIIVCSLMEAKDCNITEETCFLRDCFKDKNNMDYKPPCNETDENISVPFYHFMCLTNIAKGLRDKTNGGSQKPTAEDICKVYEKVCKRDSPNPAAKTTTPTACTTTTPTTEATTNKTTATPSATTTAEATTNKTTATPSATTTAEATTNKTTATPSATTNKTMATPSATTTTTEATTKNPQVSTTAVSTITTPSSPLNLQQKDETLQGESAGKKARSKLVLFVTFSYFSK
ncbi:mucin-5AC-like, partial [Pundamilia nyererei]|uniref:Mucin-5AC-like n=1 Tax=Pundamilia nyererei TaxID=303518 RepID=A0A9Y3VT89_9CICH